MAILFCIGYAEDIKKLLFNLSKQEMKEVFDRYSARTPEPLTAQFSGRVDKETAVKTHEEKQGQRISTQLFPASMLHFNYWLNTYKVILRRGR